MAPDVEQCWQTELNNEPVKARLLYRTMAVISNNGYIKQWVYQTMAILNNGCYIEQWLYIKQALVDMCQVSIHI